MVCFVFIFMDRESVVSTMALMATDTSVEQNPFNEKDPEEDEIIRPTVSHNGPTIISVPSNK